MPVKELGPHFQFAAWRVPQFARAIEYPLEVMEEIRAFACEELLQLSHGGDEVGGVLFGTKRDDLIRILTWRPLACEHLDGPSLRLSYNDRMNLAVQLEVARQNPDLKDLRPLGWFVSHLNGEVSLTAADLEIYNGFFPEAWQVTLVLCPQNNGNAQAGFFVRESDGNLQTETSYHSFELERPQPKAPLRAAAATADTLAPPPSQPAPPEASTPAAPPPAPPAFAPQALATPPVVPLQPPPSSSAPRPAAPLNHFDGPPEPFRAAGLRPEKSRLPPVPLTPPPAGPSFQLDEEPPRRERWLWTIPVVLALVIAGFLLYQRTSSSSASSVGLHASMDGQSALLAWDTGSRTIHDSFRGELEINDGSRDSHISLTTDQLHAGKLTYLPQSGDVTFALTVYTTNGDSTRDSTRLIAPSLNAAGAPSESVPEISAAPIAPIASTPAAAPPPPVTTPPVTAPTTAASSATAPGDPSASPDQVQQLRMALGKERARADELQNLVRILENRLGIESTEPKSARSR